MRGGPMTVKQTPRCNIFTAPGPARRRVSGFAGVSLHEMRPWRASSCRRGGPRRTPASGARRGPSVRGPRASCATVSAHRHRATRCQTGAIGAVVARFVHTEEVTGSNPVSPTIKPQVRRRLRVSNRVARNIRGTVTRLRRGTYEELPASTGHSQTPVTTLSVVRPRPDPT